jgi:hypothetical protein
MIGVLDKLGGLYWLSEFMYRYGYKNKQNCNVIKKDNEPMHTELNSRMVVLTILKFILL